MNPKEEKGAIVVEATLSLSFFVFAMLIILSITNICLAQSKIGTALNSSAMEISEYSYLYKLTNLNAKQKELAEKGEEASQQVGNIKEGVSQLYGSISGIADTGNKIDPSDFSSVLGAYDSIKNNAQQAGQSVAQIKDTIKSISNDPKSFALSIVALFANEGIEGIKTDVAAELCKAFMKKHLVDEKGGDYEAYLKWLRVVPTGGSYLDSLNFKQSQVFKDGKDSKIDLVVKYKVRVIKLLGIEKDFTFTQRAQTNGWFGNSSGE